MTERERFEAWLLSEGYPNERLKMRGRIYVDDHVDDVWDGWQARALLAAGASEPQRVELESLLASHVELNMNNYHDAEVDYLNDWAIRAYDFLKTAKGVRQ